VIPNIKFGDTMMKIIQAYFKTSALRYMLALIIAIFVFAANSKLFLLVLGILVAVDLIMTVHKQNKWKRRK